MRKDKEADEIIRFLDVSSFDHFAILAETDVAAEGSRKILKIGGLGISIR